MTRSERPPKEPIAIGLDVGGTKIEGIALDSAGNELSRLRVATPVGDYQGCVAAIAGVIEHLESNAGKATTIGMGTPGAEDAITGRLKHSNSVALNGQPLRSDVEAVLQRPVVIANDADCLALSEAIDGAGAGYPTVFAVILGTGVGGGFVVRGRLVTGPNGLAGEWGHNPLPAPRASEIPGPVCYCGRLGCIETWLSGPALEADHARVTRRDETAPTIAAKAGNNDPDSVATLDRYVDRLARSFAALINTVDPHVIVLGGGASNIEYIYGAVPAAWDRYVFGETVTTPLVPAIHGDSSGVMGAAYVGVTESQ